MFRRTGNIFLIGLLALTLTACSGDEETGGNNANNGGGEDAGAMDASDDEDAAGEQDAAEDTSDPSDTRDDTAAEDASDATTEDSVDDTSDDVSGDDAVDDDAGEDVDTRGACGTGSDQTCAFPAGSSTCDQGDWGAGSFVSTFTLEDDGDCCFDLDGDPDADLDSGLARLKSTIRLISGFEFNEIIRAQIASGGLTYLFTYSNWSNPTNDPESTLDVVFGNSSSTETQKQNGNGIFTVTADSVDANGEPLSQLAPADVCDGHMSIDGGQAPLRVPIGSELIEVTLRDVRLEADVVPPTDLSAGGKVGLANGELGGWITLADIFGGLNDVAQACDCLQKDVFIEDSSGTWTCESTADDETACANAPAFCSDFLSNKAYCDLAATTLVNNADYDGLPEGNPDGTNDSYTIGAKFTAVGGEISGTER
ncbi:MAG: hypothetical protein ACQEVA_14365 [Myxococcota bacterium]